MIQFFKKIPVSIHPFFWILAGLIGWLNSGSFAGTIIWVFVIFISVLFHEFGHAITALIFKQKPSISLIALGGVTTYENKNLSFFKQFLIVLNGPLFGVLLLLLATALLYFNIFSNPYIVGFLKITQLVNLFWSIVNLLPVLPLDGGQLVRIALEAFFGVKGFKISFLVGMIVALAFAIFFFIKGLFLIGALFFLFAFQSFDMFRKAKYLTQEDRNTKKTYDMQEGEKALQEGRKQDAKNIFRDIRDNTKKGVIHSAATHYLALLDLEEGNRKEAYDFLMEIKEQLPDEGKCLLHELAFEQKDYEQVAALSAACYQLKPSFKVALHNAMAFAFLKKGKLAGGWLQTASTYDEFDFEKISKDSIFESVSEDRDFKKFTRQINENKT